ncbi:MAG: hypothetical protein F4Y07_09955 [Gemmatimonadetes bacterium]|nr:hypothetical protein [Gemmatimonadota bacterium]MYE16787.1 hypothetical protein [Gemmatimonadota bacterium]
MQKPRNRSRQARNRILGELRRELMGPSEDDEVIREFPTARYIVGRLAPARVDDEDFDALVGAAENDTLETAAQDAETDSDAIGPPLIVGFNPAAMGLSFLIDASVDRLSVKFSWGDYRWEDTRHGHAWKRYHRQGLVTGLPVRGAGTMKPLPLSPKSAPDDILVEGVDDPEIRLEGVVHEFSGCRAVSLFLVNRRTRVSSHAFRMQKTEGRGTDGSLLFRSGSRGSWARTNW